MNLFEKRRFRKFLVWIMQVDADDSATWNSVYTFPKDIAKDNIMIAYNYFSINEDIQVC